MVKIEKEIPKDRINISKGFSNQRVNTEIPPARSETIKEFPWDGSEVHKNVDVLNRGGGWINNVISHYKLAFGNPLINPL
jgi:hypothetical protein